jgi:outer membrane immunogenic protein
MKRAWVSVPMFLGKGHVTVGKIFSTAALVCMFLSLPVAGGAADTQAPGYNWTGAYVGVNAGWARAMSDAGTSSVYSGSGYFAGSSVAAVASTGSQSLDSDAFTGGIQGGYNYQYDRFVLGCELDLNYTGINKAGSGSAAYPCCSGTGFNVDSKVRSYWRLTVRPRIGYAVDNWLLYVTGGLALAEIKADYKFTDTYADMYEASSRAQIKAGWTAGAGVEVGVWKNISVRTEYLYTDFGKVKTGGYFSGAVDPGYVEAGANNPFSHNADLRTHMVRFGINYRF